MPVGSNQYFLLIVSLPSLNFISWHDNAANSGNEPKGAAIKRKWYIHCGEVVIFLKQEKILVFIEEMQNGFRVYIA